MSKIFLQDTYAPHSICFGCGPSNKSGLRIQSVDEGEFITCRWMPAPFHEAFPGVLNGGIIGTLLDCHCNWTAAWNLKKKWALKEVPCTVTAEYTIQLFKPTPSGKEIYMKSHVLEFIKEDRAWIHGELFVEDKKTATCKGLFVAVKDNHPAYHRWS